MITASSEFEELDFGVTAASSLDAISQVSERVRPIA